MKTAVLQNIEVKRIPFDDVCFVFFKCFLKSPHFILLLPPSVFVEPV